MTAISALRMVVPNLLSLDRSWLQSRLHVDWHPFPFATAKSAACLTIRSSHPTHLLKRMLEKCLHVVINARRQLVAVPADPALNVPKGKLDGVEDKGVGGEKFNDSTRRPYVLHPVVIVVDGAVVQYHDTMLVRLVVLLQIGNNVLSHCGCKRLCVVASLDDVHLPQHAVARVAADHRVLLLAEFEHTPSGAFTPDRSSRTTLCCLVLHTRLVDKHELVSPILPPNLVAPFLAFIIVGRAGYKVDLLARIVPSMKHSTDRGLRYTEPGTHVHVALDLVDGQVGLRLEDGLEFIQAASMGATCPSRPDPCQVAKHLRVA
mmetsp:Transcript_14827/g.36002  ORF Transcript_14827/g.36002 Transcript_14827/m.36002 type:complete len:318 (-) Transcript_14827:29-982(-)